MTWQRKIAMERVTTQSQESVRVVSRRLFIFLRLSSRVVLTHAWMTKLYSLIEETASVSGSVLRRTKLQAKESGL